MMNVRILYIICLSVVIFLAGCEARNGLAPVSELKWNPYARHQKTHRVVRGETLYAVAFRYDTDYRTLAALNHLRPPYALRVGQMLRIQGVPKVHYQASRSYRPKAHTPVRTAVRKPIVTAPIVSRGSSSWIWPVRGRVVTGFDPNTGKKGINIACNSGDKIHASSAGTVAYAGSGLAGYGNLIIIKHNNEFLTAYGNNARNLVREGQKVQKGQVIAVSGLVDNKYQGVHFEIRKRGKPVNPLQYIR